jgi:hypothetical protein
VRERRPGTGRRIADTASIEKIYQYCGLDCEINVLSDVLNYRCDLDNVELADHHSNNIAALIEDGTAATTWLNWRGNLEISRVVP